MLSIYIVIFLNPSFNIFIAAFISLLCSALHLGQIHSRIFKSFTSSFLYPHLLHSCELAKNLSTLITFLPYQLALYSNCLINYDHDTSDIDLASFSFLIMFLTCKSSIQIISFSFINLVDSFCKKSFL